MLSLYQHLPEYINPVTASVGFFSIRWYSLGYLVGFLVVYILLRYRIKRGEFDISKFLISKSEFLNKSQVSNSKALSFLADLLIYLILGLLVGARLGFVIFYDLNYFISHPLEIISPVQITNYELRITGIYGLSYFGGLIGVIISGWFFSRKNKLSFSKLTDFVVPAIPAGYFFGRLGNFLNGELYGRATNVPWGMYFPTDPSRILRHPSQLYEAFFEGIFLFLVLWSLRNSVFMRGKLLAAYLAGYALLRFICEFFREPDPQIGLIRGYFTLGQIFSLVLAIVSLNFIIWRNQKI